MGSHQLKFTSMNPLAPMTTLPFQYLRCPLTMVLNLYNFLWILILKQIFLHLGADADTIDNAEALVDQSFYVESSVSLTNTYCVKLNDLCRVCGKSSDVKFDIFGPEGRKRQLVDKIHKHLPIAVTKNDKLPLQVCNVCAMHLDICHQLVQCCEQAEKNLNLMISKDTTSEKTIETGLECLNHPELVASVSDSSAINTPRPKASSNANSNKVVSKLN